MHLGPWASAKAEAITAPFVEDYAKATLQLLL
jgi:hypothetical protein